MDNEWQYPTMPSSGKRVADDVGDDHRDEGKGKEGDGDMKDEGMKEKEESKETSTRSSQPKHRDERRRVEAPQ